MLFRSVRTAMFENNAYRYHTPDNAARLASAGVDVYVSSGGERAGTRFLGFNVALAVGHGLDAEVALQGITHKAAEFLGVDKRIGRIVPGMDADLVIWDGDPLSSTAHVEKVFVGGTIVYDASKHRRRMVKK